MRIRLLGTAAGGGFPQWNCGCRNCRGVRSGTLRASARTQSSMAISADGRRWFLVNASPDVRAQIESFPPLTEVSATRGTAIEGVLLTSADLDHTLGLFILREGERLAVHAPPPIRRAVEQDLGMGRILDRYCGIQWHEPPMTDLADLHDRAGLPSGLKYTAFAVAGKPPRYASHRYAREASASAGDAVGYRFVDPATGGRVVCVPGIAAIDAAAWRQLGDCDLLFLDGTFWSEQEMSATGVGGIGGSGAATASEMGHCPVGGPDGSLARIRGLPAGRVVFVHINNTNPMLLDDSPERKTVQAAGAAVGADGMEFVV